MPRLRLRNSIELHILDLCWTNVTDILPAPQQPLKGISKPIHK